MPRARLIPLVAAALIAGCDVHGPTDPGALARIEVSPAATVFPLATHQLTAVGFDAEGKEIAISPTWAVDGGSITAGGLLTAPATPGQYTVTATNGGVSGAVTIVVAPGPVASLSIQPASASLSVGGTQTFVVVAKDVGGNTVAASPQWSVVNGGGTISQAGVFTAGGTAGTFVNTIRATANGISTFATVTVTAGTLSTITVSPASASLVPGGTQQFAAVGRDAAGNVVSITPTWSVAAGGGTITTTGVFTAGAAPGTYTNTVVATSGSVSGRASVTVTTGSVASITVSPNPASMSVFASLQFTAVARDAAGNVLSITPTWTIASGSGSGAVLSTTGVYTAGGIPGIYPNEVVASAGGVSGSASVVVSGGPPTNSAFLGNAAGFGVLAGAGVSCATSGAVRGPVAHVGSSPTATVTGFPSPCTLTGVVAGAAEAAAAQTSLAAAITALSGTAGCVDLSGIDLGSFTALNPLPGGCYSFTAGATLNGTLALEGSTTAQWIFITGTTLDVGDGAVVTLSGGGIRDNVRWVVGTTATVGINARMEGNILANTSIVLRAGATVQGRALAKNGTVTMTDGGVVIIKP